jgi:transcriptional regulator with XRE-family HTH domain
MGAEAAKPDEAAPRLAKVIGKNARQLRTDVGLTLDQVSIAAQMRGLNWSESRVADFESGRVAPNLATLIAFCFALADAGCAEATFPELLRSETPIQINDSLLLSNKQVVNLLSRLPPWGPGLLPPPEAIKAFDATTASGATEERTRKALGISRMELADWAAAQGWKRTFSQERDHRAGEGANAQKRGQVTRQMRKELQAAIEAANHGDDKQLQHRTGEALPRPVPHSGPQVDTETRLQDKA